MRHNAFIKNSCYNEANKNLILENCGAMPDKIAELEAKLVTVTDLNERIDLLNALAWALQDENLTRALSLSAEAIALAQPDKMLPPCYSKGLAQGVFYLGYFEQEAGHYETALTYLSEALPLYEQLGDLAGQAAVVSRVGETYAYLGNYSDSLAYQLQALKLSTAIQDPMKEANALNLIGLVYYFTADYEQSLHYVQQAWHIYEALGDKRGQGKALNNMGMMYCYLGNYDEALGCCFKSFQLCEETKDRDGLANVFDSIGTIYQDLTNYSQALHYFRRGLELFQQMDKPAAVLECLRNMGDSYYRLQDLPRALEYLERAVAMAEQLVVRRELYMGYELLAKVYNQMRDFETALIYYEKFHNLKESVLNEEATEKLKKLEILHRTETTNKEAEIYRLKNVALEKEITERKRVEDALRQSELELQQTNHELAKLNVDKDRFLSLMAHDLRSPFMPLLGLTKLLLETPAVANLPEVEHMARSIYESSKRIYNLLEDLLQWARLHMGRMTYEARRVDLAQVATKTVQLLYHNAHNKHITLQNHLAAPLWVQGEPHMLNVILRNLISNAIKFTPMGGQIELWVTLLATEPPFVQISVRDTGMGISPENVAKLFKIEIHHSTLGTAQEQGTGLGLIMCREMIDLHGGQIWVESEVGHGTTIKFTVPLDSSMEAAAMITPIQVADMSVTTSDTPAMSYPLLPIEWLSLLLNLALAGDMVAIQAKAAEIVELDGSFQLVTEQLQHLASQFDEEAILDLLKQQMDRVQNS